MENYEKFIIARYLCADLCRWVPGFRDNEKSWYEGPEGELASVSDFRRICLGRIERLSFHAKEYFEVAHPEWIHEVQRKINIDKSRWERDAASDPEADNIADILDSVSRIIIELNRGTRAY
mgnify:CR=1 FL=1